MIRRRLTATLIGGLLFAGVGAEAQVAVNPPFFNPGATAFEPIPAAIPSGVTLPVTANVSADRKYVTLGLKPVNQSLLALVPFSFAGGQGGGFVGTPVVPVNPGGGAGGGGTGKPGVKPAAPTGAARDLSG